MSLFRSVMQQAPVAQTLSWAPEIGLSRREQEMLELLRQRLTNKEIALRLNLSEQTVKNHVHHVLRKFGATNRFSLIEVCESKRIGGERVVVLESESALADRKLVSTTNPAA